MKAIFLPIVLCLVWAATAVAGEIAPEDAAKHVGETATVRGLVVDVHGAKKATFLNFGGKYPNQVFSAVSFVVPYAQLAGFEGQTVAVTGVIQDYKGKPEIVINALSQVAR